MSKNNVNPMIFYYKFINGYKDEDGITHYHYSDDDGNLIEVCDIGVKYMDKYYNLWSSFITIFPMELYVGSYAYVLENLSKNNNTYFSVICKDICLLIRHYLLYINDMYKYEYDNVICDAELPGDETFCIDGDNIC